MPFTYRVVDLRTGMVDPIETLVHGVNTPEEAARKVVGHRVVRSGAKKDLIARVYWQPIGQPVTMVRLYKMVGE